MKRSEVYDRAAREVQRGWIQLDTGKWEQPYGPVCAFGAILRVVRVEQTQDVLAGRVGRTSTSRVWDAAAAHSRALLPLANEGWPLVRPACDCQGCLEDGDPIPKWGSLPTFNDAVGRTQADIVALLEKGRAAAEEAGE